ncbi:MAG: MopE-related protein [Myxococcota bacterium]
MSLRLGYGLAASAVCLLLALSAGCKRDPAKVDRDADGSTADVDCDDEDPTVRPGTIEDPYNGIDDDCDPATVDDDLDGDGFLAADECDDLDALVRPDAEEVPYDGVDNDCDPLTLDDDLDEDGFGRAEDCADGNPDIRPDAEEIFYDGIDNDCNPLTPDDDQDADGVPADLDCDDLDPFVRAGGTYFVDCDADGFSATDVGSVASCTLPSAPASCPDGTWTLIEPVGPANDPGNASVDCADADPLANPDQTDTFATAAVGAPASLPFDYDCNGEEEGLYGTFTCSVQPATVPGTFFCSHLPGFVGPTDCGAVGDYASGCTLIDDTTCEAATMEPRTQECR